MTENEFAAAGGSNNNYLSIGNYFTTGMDGVSNKTIASKCWYTLKPSFEVVSSATNPTVLSYGQIVELTSVDRAGTVRQRFGIFIKAPNSNATTHAPAASNGSGWYMTGSSDSDAKSAACQAMGLSSSNVSKLSYNYSSNANYIWFKVSCGGVARGFFAKLS